MLNLTIKNCFFYHEVIDDSNKVVAKIKNMQFWSAAKKIVNIRGETIYTTDIINIKKDYNLYNYDENRRYVIYEKQRVIASCSLVYFKNDSRSIFQRFCFRPPVVDEIKVETDYGEFNIKRQSNSKLIIYNNGIIVGSITNCFALIYQQISCTTINNSAFLAALFVLSKYMINEDDYMIV